MIKTFADKRTQELYSMGKTKKFPPDVAQRAARKLEYVHLAESLEDLKVPLAIGSTRFQATDRGSTLFRSMRSGASAFVLRMVILTTLKSATTIEVR